MAVSHDFAPPFKLIAPYFIIGMVFFVISVTLTFGLNIADINSSNNTTLAWVHLFLLGFVMMVIFGAMAQLVPVVLEVGHFAVDLYYVIYPLLFIGTILMSLGFLFYPSLLPYGGIIVLISLLIFILETFLTIKKVKKFNLVMTTVLVANTFLFIGLIFGILMALGYAGTINVDIMALLRGHIYLVLAGYVGITIMGMSLILLPMFWLSHSFSWKPVEYALWSMGVAVTWVMLSSILDSIVLEFLGYNLAIIALILYFYQIYLIYTTRVRMENDIYLHSLIFSYSNLIIAIIMGLIYLINSNEHLLLAIGWTLFMGYIAFIINGHLYKIVPFLVWYQRFSPLIGKQKVPMLADMIPKRSAKFQFGFSSSGVLIATFGILIASNQTFHIGVGFLFVGSIFMLKDLMYMINFKG
jgi:hypothetical protein